MKATEKLNLFGAELGILRLELLAIIEWFLESRQANCAIILREI